MASSSKRQAREREERQADKDVRKLMRRLKKLRREQAVVRFPPGATVLSGSIELEGNVRIEGQPRRFAADPEMTAPLTTMMDRERQHFSCLCCCYCETFLDKTIICGSCGLPCSCEGCVADQPDAEIVASIAGTDVAQALDESGHLQELSEDTA